MIPPPCPPDLERTPSVQNRYTSAGLWCFERHFETQEERRPLNLIIFDCDETLTLSTFLPGDRVMQTQLDWSSEWEEYIATMNFETPGSPFTIGRLEQLQETLAELAKGWTLAVLTRNTSGPIACLNLLRAAKLAQYFSAVWGMSRVVGVKAGIYWTGSEWKCFDPPLAQIPDHKAHVVHSIAERPCAWFPQLVEGSGGSFLLPETLRPEEIMLVDDEGTNFQSSAGVGRTVLRGCKVARYDVASFRDMGFIRDMGGIGAHCVEDFEALKNFAQRPWAYKAGSTVTCMERSFKGSQERPVVKLVVFDFDATLTLCSFMPRDARCSKEIGYIVSGDAERERHVMYNFESPYVEGSRPEKLRKMLQELACDPKTGERRVLSVLTKNESGAIAVLNLLMMAGLADYFSAIWTPSALKGRSGAVYKDASGWHDFPLPMRNPDGQHYKAAVLRSIVEEPKRWFPQMADEADGEEARDEKRLLHGLSLANIVLVDDEPDAFRQLPVGEFEHRVLRRCRVASYDDEYRDKGFIWHMGGLGARSDQDYATLLSFVQQPWLFAEGSGLGPPPVLVRRLTGEGAQDAELQRNPSGSDRQVRMSSMMFEGGHKQIWLGEFLDSADGESGTAADNGWRGCAVAVVKAGYKLKNECQIWKDVCKPGHPNILKMLHFFEDREVVAMELVAPIGFNLGELASKRFKSNGAHLPTGLVAAIFTQLAGALRYLHVEKEIVHRDLKPEHVLVDTEHQVKLCSFGAARTIREIKDRKDKRYIQSFKGTNIAPEIWEGGFFEPRPAYGGEVDCYSLGYTLQDIYARTQDAPAEVEKSWRNLMDSDPKRRMTLDQFEECEWMVPDALASNNS